MLRWWSMMHRLRTAILTALLVWAALSSAAQARGKGAPVLVEVPGLGSLLLVGSDGAHALDRYVRGLVRREIYPGAETELLRWGQTVQAAARFSSVDSLRRTGRPVVGIQLNLLSSLVGGPKSSWGERAVAAAVRRAGGEPVFLPAGASVRDIDPLLGAVDHVILSGGDDVHPALYRHEVTFSRGISLPRDRYERRLINRALRRGIGLDGICRGAQLLNVVRGGTLFQDLLLDQATTVPHGNGPGRPERRHRVVLAGDSCIARVVGQTRLTTVSSHHQAVDRPGRDLRVIGRSVDGVVEAFESQDGKARGYQFHPEASRGRASRSLFADIVRRARVAGR